jgi:hypothetical protein
VSLASRTRSREKSFIETTRSTHLFDGGQEIRANIQLRIGKGTSAVIVKRANALTQPFRTLFRVGVVGATAEIVSILP